MSGWSVIGECAGCDAKAYSHPTDRTRDYGEPHAPECRVYRAQLERIAQDDKSLAALDAALAEGTRRLALPVGPRLPARASDDLQARARAEWEEDQRLSMRTEPPTAEEYGLPASFGEDME